MKSRSIILFFLLSILTISCTDDLTNVGAGLDPTSLEIAIGADTFHVATETVIVDYMYSKPDSFLLGNFYDAKYGSTRADVFAQVNCPRNFIYPEGSVIDSAKVLLYYRSSFGDAYSPMEISIYEMDKDTTFSYSELYPTNLDPAVFTTKLKNIGSSIISAKNSANKFNSPITVQLSKVFRESFFNIEKDTYSSEKNFLKFFKGMYITTNLGASSMLNVFRIDLMCYYHYKVVKPGQVTETTIKDVILFPANGEVRQVNRIQHPDTTAIKLSLLQKDTVSYISSPANIQTRILLPMGRINKRINDKLIDKKRTVNSAVLRVDEAVDPDLNTLLPQRKIQYLLLIKESAMNRFFENRELPSDTCAVLGQYTQSLNSSNYYSFDVASLLAKELKVNPGAASDLKLRLIPVRVSGVNSNGSMRITSVKQEFQMSAVSIRNGKNVKSPMRIKMLYSGF